jgi:hypothetical protein
MNLKLRAMAAAVALLAASGAAQAAVDDFTTGNGELFLNVYDPTAATPLSYYFDLGAPAAMATPGGPFTPAAGTTFNMNDFLPTGVTPNGAGLAPTVGNPAGLAPGYVETPGTSFLWHITGTNGFAAFLAGATANTNWKWNVVAGDSTGSQGIVDQVRYVFTSNSGLATILGTTTSNLNNMKGVNPFITTGINPPALNPDDSGTFLSPSAGYFGTGFTDSFNGRLNGSISGAVGNQMPFYYITGRAASTVQGQQYANGAFFSFLQEPAGNYDLVYTVPVPEPGTFAMLVAGLLAVGGIARRRLSA